METRTHNRGPEVAVAIRAVEAEDVSAVRSLHARSFAELARQHHTPTQIEAYVRLILDELYRDELLSNNLLVAEEQEGRIIGTAGWCAVAGAPRTARIRKVFIAPETAGRGLGRRLVQEVEQRAIEIGYTRFVVRANANAVGFYQRLGYRTTQSGRMPAAGGIELPVIFLEKS
jgi:GNAT superfamily N-acetyltransferase